MNHITDIIRKRPYVQYTARGFSLESLGHSSNKVICHENQNSSKKEGKSFNKSCGRLSHNEPFLR